MSFFEELKRRNVFRVGIAYAISAWVLLQVVDLVLENITAPGWIMQVFMLALAIGFPVALIFAWAFEMTPEGIKKERDVDRSQSVTPKTGRKLDRSIIIVLIIALGWFAWDKFSEPVPDINSEHAATQIAQTKPVPVQKTAATKPGEKSVAVLPFINMSDDKQNEYFSDGISEELLNVLVRVKGLRVPSRTSSFTFKGSTLKLAEIGKELKVDHILEGSVRKSGDRIRVTAQLIEVHTDTHLWSETYTRKLDDVFAVQDEIAQAIVSALKVTLTGNQKTTLQNRPTENIDAYNKYLLGRHLWNQRTNDSLLAAIEPLSEAVALDPGYDQAWAALADTYVLMPEYGAGSITEHIPLAHKAIEHALAINPESARALTTFAYIKFMYDYDFSGAQADFEKAISIDPTYATAHQWYGEFLATQLRLNEALEQLEIARQLDPLAPIIPHVIGWVLGSTDRTEEAFAYYAKALELSPHRSSTIGNLINLNIRTGHFDQARIYSREFETLVGEDPDTVLAVIDAVENPELKAEALRQLEQDHATPDGMGGAAYYLMFLGEPDLALDSLERGFAAGDPYVVHLKRERVFEPLHDNPRFQALLKKMNLWP